ncbi:hypothetical protein [Rahnella sp. ChDrAdgB13]|uniref:hypothetical protein n=1 Tax=Rahnella sp. ChDrAdgB13 TaxID=1850581 RepID=UPI001AD85655|nr:hypothetical protein [Rahnella sp. ChDrAdgB13]
MTKITAAEIIDIMLGKTLTYAELRKLFAEKYPDRDLPARELSPKLQSVVNSLMRSPYADIARTPGRENKYHLVHVSPEFYRVGGAKKPKKKMDTGSSQRMPKVRPQMSPEDAQCCHMASLFNQLLMPVRQRFTGGIQ